MITWIKPLNYPKMQIIGYWIGHCLPSNYKFSMEIATGKVVGVRDTMVTSILKLEIRADILVAHPNYFSEIVSALG